MMFWKRKKPEQAPDATPISRSVKRAFAKCPSCQRDLPYNETQYRPGETLNIRCGSCETPFRFTVPTAPRQIPPTPRQPLSAIGKTPARSPATPARDLARPRERQEAPQDIELEEKRAYLKRLNLVEQKDAARRSTAAAPPSANRITTQAEPRKAAKPAMLLATPSPEFTKDAAIDGSNVASQLGTYNAAERDTVPDITAVEKVEARMKSDGFTTQVFLDSKFLGFLRAVHETQYHFAKDRIDVGEWICSPRGVEADHLLLTRATQENGYVVSNDNFEDLASDFPWVSANPQRRIKVQRLGNGNFTLAAANQVEQQALRKQQLEQEKARQRSHAPRLRRPEGSPNPPLQAPPSKSRLDRRAPTNQRTSPKLDIAELRERVLLPAFLAAKEIDHDWVGGSAFGNAIRRIQPGFDAATYGQPKLRRLLESMPTMFRVENGTATDPEASGMRIYLVPTRASKSRPATTKTRTKKNGATKKKPTATKRSKAKPAQSKASRRKVKG